jgi:hypothetical protein
MMRPRPGPLTKRSPLPPDAVQALRSRIAETGPTAGVRVAHDAPPGSCAAGEWAP